MIFSIFRCFCIRRFQIVKYCPNIHQWKDYLFSFQMMNTSQFRNIDPYDWFCAPASRISSSRIYLTDCNQSVNFELLGYLAFHYMLFQTSGKKTSKFYSFALYLFVSVDVSSKTSLKVFSPFQQHFQTPYFTVLFLSIFYRSLPMGLFISLTWFYLLLYLYLRL